MKWSVAAALLLIPCVGFAGSLYTTPYKSTNHPGSSKNQSAAPKGCPITEFCKLSFSDEDSGFGDMEMNPFDTGTDYKINALNYSLSLGDETTVPFQVYLGEVTKADDAKTTNTKAMLDPTQGVAIQVPWLYRWGGSKGGFCSFKVADGHCIGGGDLTFRYLELNQTDSTKGVFGFSAGIGASMMVPFMQDGVTGEAGHISLSAKLRANFHNHDQPDKLFGAIRDKNGDPIKYNKWFGALHIGSEIAINDAVTVLVEYFKPFDNKAHMDEVFKVSFTLNKF